MAVDSRYRVGAGVLGLSIAFASLGAWATVIEPERLVVRPARIPLPRWPMAWEGLRIAAIADIHAGSPHVGYAQLDHLVRTANEQRPDLVVLLGDYVCRRTPQEGVEKPENVAAKLSELRAPLGVVAVLGNHDWWLDGPRMRRAFEDAGMRVLDNEALRLERAGQPLWLVGIADALTGNPRIDVALGKVPAGDPVVVLTHNPDLFDHEVPERVVLTLAGHTHGGQVRLPLIGAPIVPSAFGQRYAEGIVVEGKRTLFVTPGIGTSVLPIRLGVPPEISLLSVVAGGAAPR
jgi:predicted MPP superfamily phosphohydrolase